MKMPRKIKRKWLKALRSGEYGQTKGVLTNGKGGFCCLGVLQHVVTGGSCEAGASGFRSFPSEEWYKSVGIKEATGSADEAKLAAMNDGEYHEGGGKIVSRNFKTIANWIEENIETTD